VAADGEVVGVEVMERQLLDKRFTQTRSNSVLISEVRFKVFSFLSVEDHPLAPSSSRAKNA
jgi:hypothetical protein